MMPISGVNTGTAKPLTSVGEVNEKSKVQDTEEKEQERLPKPIRDQYIPEAKGPDKKEPEKKTEKCVGNTDKVDREIEKLKRKQKELKQQIHSETDGAKIKELEGELAQVERELRQKDNDGYRRRHTRFS